MPDQYQTDYLNKQVAAMKLERESFIDQWQQLSRFITPRRGRFTVTDRNKGDRRWNNIINSVGSTAHRVAKAGMYAGLMSPSRPWFKMETDNKELMEYMPVKIWCYQVTQIIAKVLSSSNFYNMAPTLIGENLNYATGYMTHDDDFENVARFYTHTIGSYMIAQDASFRINRTAREFQATSDQVIQIAGGDMSKVSQSVKTAYDRSDYSSWFDVVQFIEPNKQYNPRMMESRYGMKFRSCYFEPSQTKNNRDTLLDDKGYNEFPGYALRWDVAGEDIYGTDCPAMMALGDIKGLQTQEKRKAQGIDKMVSPPMGGPTSLRNVPVSSLPGGLTTYDATGNGQKLEALYQVNLRLQELRSDMDAVEQRIKTAFFNDLFLPISNMEGVQPQNQLTITSRNQEALLQLGPVIERYHNELLGPVIDRVFAQIVRAKIIPPVPPQLSGAPLKITYISSLALAQRSVTLGDMERLVTFVGAVVKSGFGDAVDKVDADQLIDEYSSNLGTPPSVILSDGMVAQKRQIRAQQQQQMQAAQMAGQVVQGVNTLANSPTDKPNALTSLMGQGVSV